MAVKTWFKRKKHWLKSNKGSSLIEIVVATVVMAMVLTAIMAALTLSLKTTAESKYRVQATKKAQQAIEVFRRERTLLGWDSFLISMQANSSYCLATLPEPRTSFTPGACGAEDVLVISGYDFYREATVTVDLTDANDPQVIVTVSVDWKIGDNDRGVDMVQDFRRY